VERLQGLQDKGVVEEPAQLGAQVRLGGLRHDPSDQTLSWTTAANEAAASEHILAKVFRFCTGWPDCTQASRGPCFGTAEPTRLILLTR
jgi:hypothetical protein